MFCSFVYIKLTAKNAPALYHIDSFVLDAPKTTLFLGLPTEYMLEYNNKLLNSKYKYNSTSCNNNNNNNGHINAIIGCKNDCDNNSSDNSYSISNSISLEYEHHDININNGVDEDDGGSDTVDEQQQQQHNQQQFICTGSCKMIDDISNYDNQFNRDDFHYEINNVAYSDTDNNDMVSNEVENMPKDLQRQQTTSTSCGVSEEITSVSGIKYNSKTSKNNNNKSNSNVFSWCNEEEFAYLDSWRNLGFIAAGASRRIQNRNNNNNESPDLQTITTISTAASLPAMTRTSTTETPSSISSLSKQQQSIIPITKNSTSSYCSSSDSRTVSSSTTTRDYAESSPIFVIDLYNNQQKRQQQQQQQFNKYQCSLTN